MAPTVAPVVILSAPAVAPAVAPSIPVEVPTNPAATQPVLAMFAVPVPVSGVTRAAPEFPAAADVTLLDLLAFSAGAAAVPEDVACTGVYPDMDVPQDTACTGACPDMAIPEDVACTEAYPDAALHVVVAYMAAYPDAALHMAVAYMAAYPDAALHVAVACMAACPDVTIHEEVAYVEVVRTDTRASDDNVSVHSEGERLRVRPGGSRLLRRRDYAVQ